ncbi:hypothetical protein [Sphingorhabdus sp.]|jgi:hypothetical protein|uniref:hypothetical protein n=1 Tax=Sphingorhabdus sp. TaxID=1902408 RepID=UPI002621E35B|nr:hypothetical protein [Sphingorhabdus sp.]MDH4399375.1 hypothetical protein [Sphingorhabdus sp.]
MRWSVKNLAAIILVGAVAACAPSPVKVVPLSAAPALTPAMPLPPGGAAVSMTIPPIGLDGVRVTPNRGLSRDEQIWHFRSALNVAALNCQGPVWGQIANEYNKFIVIHKVLLSKTSKAVDREYVKRYPKQNGLRIRDTKLTDLYNYFALPPVRAQYCDMSLRKLTEANQVPKEALAEYAIGGLIDIDTLFVNFYDAYVKYQGDLADWNMKYAPKPVYAPPNNIMAPPVTAPPAGVATPLQPG